MANIDLTEEFLDPLGQYLDYDAYEPDQRAVLHNQKHTDLRVFEHLDTAVGSPISDLDADTMSLLSTEEMMDLQSTIISTEGESWTISTVGIDSSRQNLRTLRVALASGVQQLVYSAIPDSPVDISSYASDDYITIALPAYPSSSLNPAQNFLYLVDSDGNTSLTAFSTSTLAPLTGNTELRIPIAALDPDLDLANIITVGFQLIATSNVTVTVMALRAVSKLWEAGAMDYDTRYHSFRRNAPRNGDLTSVPEFDQPIYWRGSNPPEDDDPRPIDGEVGISFNTGSLGQSNTVAVYFRELTEDFLTQGDLDGSLQSSFDGNPQPDIGAARFNTTDQDALDIYDQSSLDLKKMIDLERVPDLFSSSFISFTLNWTPTGGGIGIFATGLAETVNNGSTFSLDGPLVANQEYLLVAKLEDHTANAKLYKVDSAGNVGDLVYDTLAYTDDNAFKRRKGRYGWYANLRDGDAHVDGIRARGFVYAEYRSSPFLSNTPVIGAELFAGGSPNTEHFTDFVPGPYNSPLYSTLDRDAARSTSGNSWRLTNLGAQPAQSIFSNLFTISDFHNSEIQFDLFYPRSALDASNDLQAALVDEFNLRATALLLPQIVPDQWQRIRILLSTGDVLLTGRYRLLLTVPHAQVMTFWVDSPTIFSRSVIWEGRSVVDDPWLSNDARWTPYGSIINQSAGGVLFPRRGTELQIRARALDQNSSISRIQVKPKYAELGNLKPSAVTVPSIAPTGTFTTASLGVRKLSFTSTSTDSDGTIANIEWNFGDGASGIGSYIEHTYDEVGSYTATIIVTDNNGNRTFGTSVVAV